VIEPSISDALEVLFPHLSPTLFSPQEIAALRHMAGFLTCSARGGFETRLDSCPQVDLQQCVLSQDGGPQRLREFLTGRFTSATSTSSKWVRVDGFLAQWGDTSSVLHREIPELWLELDNLGTSTPSPETELPLSFFLGLKAQPGRLQDRFKVAKEAIDLLLETAWRDWQANVKICFESCGEEAFISHLGVMLGRPAPALRINIKQLQVDGVAKFLRDVDWPGNVEEVMAFLESLDELGGFTICLDVGAEIFPQIAFECVPKRSEDAHAWNGFLDSIVQKGWCLPEKRDALLLWPGFITPANSEAPWPASLIHASLLKPVDQFTVFERQISHVKLTLRPGRTVEAKAYFGFIHHWLRPNSAH
jgi:hypothetical protein